MRRWIPPLLSLAAVVAAAVLLVVAFQSGREEEAAPMRRGAVMRVFPEPGAVALRQDAVGVELAIGYEAQLAIDGRIIPDDQVSRISGINRLSFTPGPGKEIEQLDEGRHCASVRYWPAGQQPDDAGAPVQWCFQSA